MSDPGGILIVSGTNRPGSNSRRVADILHRRYTEAGQSSAVFGLEQLPAEAFLPGVYTDKPAAVRDIQQRVLSAAGLHVVTPEYNGSFPGLLKHFIDLLQFPESFDAKPVAFTGLSLGMFGALRAVEQLQMIFAYRNAHIYPQRVFIPAVATKFAPDGTLVDADVDTRLATQAAGFVSYTKGFAVPA